MKIGYAPDKDYYVDELTVDENMILLGRVKGMTMEDIMSTSKSLKRMLNLQEHSDKYAD